METAGDEKGVMRVRHVPKASDAPARGCPPAILVLQCAGPLSCISLGGHPDAQSRVSSVATEGTSLTANVSTHLVSQ